MTDQERIQAMADGLKEAFPIKVRSQGVPADVIAKIGTSVTREQVKAIIVAFRTLVTTAVSDIKITWVQALANMAISAALSDINIDKLCDFLGLPE